MKGVAKAAGLPVLEEDYDSLSDEQLSTLKLKFEQHKKVRFEGPAQEFWRQVARAFVEADNGSGVVDRPGFSALCETMFGSFGTLKEATGTGIDDFFVCYTVCGRFCAPL